MEEETSLEAAAEALESMDTQEQGLTQDEVETTETEETQTDEQEAPEPDEAPEEEEQTDELADYELEDAVYKLPAELKAHIDKLKSSEFRESDYTKKTQALAEERKNWEQAKQQQIQAETQKLQQERDLWMQVAQGQGIQKPDETLLDENSDNYNPEEFLKQQIRYEKAQAQVEQTKRQEQQRNQAVVQEEARKLMQADPSWSDPEVFQKDHQAMLNQFRSLGATDEEIGNIGDHRIYLLANKAAKYDALMSKKTEVAKKVIKAPAKVERSGVPSSKEGRKAKDAVSRLRRTGKQDDAAEAISAIFD